MSFEEYDLICSLGGNCTVSMQMQKRDLRFLSLPFDWIWYNQKESFYALANGFQNNFSDFLIYENMRKLEKGEYSDAHLGRCQYQDMNTKIFYYNHFNQTDNEKKEFLLGKQKFFKRCIRLDNFLKNSQKVLFIASFVFELDIEDIINLKEIIEKKYPNCEVDFYVQAFNCNNEETIDLSGIQYVKYIRCENNYDYLKTNYCWTFMDKLKLSERFYKNNFIFNKSSKDIICNKILIFSKIDNGLFFNFFPLLPSIIFIKLYWFNKRIQFLIGKNRK